MKAQILKIAKVKSEKEFYKKYPSEEAFMKVHGKAFKKVQFGTYIGGDTNAAPEMIDYNAMYKSADRGVTGMDDDMRQAQADRAASQAASKGGESGGGIGDIMGMLGGAGEGEDGGGGIMSMLGGGGGDAAGAAGEAGGMADLAALAAKDGIYIPSAASGTNMNNWWSSMTTDTTTTMFAPTSKFPKPPISNDVETPPSIPGHEAKGPTPEETMKQNMAIVGDTSGPIDTAGDQGLSSKLGGVTKMLGPVGDVIGGLGELEQEREALKVAKRDEQLSGLQLRASQTRPEMKERKYVRPEDVRNTGEEFFPIYGVGTNVLARSGARLQGGGMIGGNPTEIQNTYSNGYDIYTDGGYEPLQDPNQVKDFRHGGYLHTMQTGGSAGGGTPWGAISSQVTGMGQSLMPGGRNAGGGIGSTVGSTLGTAFGGPIGGAIGGFVGGMAGNLLDTNTKNTQLAQESTKRNTQNIAMNQMAPAIQAGYASHLQNGGYMNPNYNPQLITMFGDHNSDDFADYANKFRAGGHLKEYTAPSERAMETYKNGGQMSSYAMGGELQTHWGGEAETMSYNPYMPGSGETVVFRGQSHNESDREGNTGIGITYGDNPVEVERGEPMIQMQAGGNVDPETGEPEVTGVVFGNMEINKKVAAQFNDEELMPIASKYHGKKFKNVGIDLAKQEVRQNKIIDKSSNELDSLEVNTPFDKLKLSSLRANIEGANLKLKGIADTKITLANYQNAINDTKEEMSDAFGQNISAEHLAKGLIKLDKDPVTKDAKWGGDIAKKAKDGVTTTKETTIIPKKTKAQLKAEGYTLGADGKYHLKKKGVKKPDTETKSANAMDNIPKQKVDKTTGLGEITPTQFEEFKKKNSWYDGWANFDPKNQNDVDKYAKAFNAESEKRGSKARILPDDKKTGKTKFVGKQFISADLGDEKKVGEAPEEELIAEEDVPDTIIPKKPRFPWEIPVNAALDYFRPTDQSPLDYNQLMGEMYALSSNQLDPVQAQMYKPELGIPYDISYQDLLNENQADYNSAQRMAGYNPAAQANLNAQKYQANQKVLAEQFRANQAMKDQVYSGNRQTLNQAKLANLGMLDKQYERQSQAMSNTKATTQAALSSMSDKYAKNKLENRKLSIYENMYNYRFGKSGRAQNWNGLQFFDTTIGGGKGKGESDIPEGYKATAYDANGNPISLKRITEKDMEDDEAALEAVGGIKNKNGGSTKKNYKNSSVVKAYKNL